MLIENSIQGYSSELEFARICLSKGIQCSKPLFPDKYDFITDFNGKLVRVQVKSTRYRVKDRKSVSYMVNVSNGKDKSYVKEQVDILAIHVIPENKWYLVPVELADKVTKLRITISRVNARKFNTTQDMYEGNWHILTD